jgi:hypothetical protein
MKFKTIPKVPYIAVQVAGAMVVAPAAAILALNLQQFLRVGDPGSCILSAIVLATAFVLPSNWSKTEAVVRLVAAIGFATLAGMLFESSRTEVWAWLSVVAAMVAAHPGVGWRRMGRRSSVATTFALVLALVVAVSTEFALMELVGRSDSLIVGSFAMMVGAGMALAGQFKLQPRLPGAAAADAAVSPQITGRFADAWQAVETHASVVGDALNLLRSLSPAGSSEADRIDRELETTLGNARTSIQRWSCVSEAREQAERFERRLNDAANRLSVEDEPIVRRELAVLCARYRAAADAAAMHARDERATMVRLEQLVAALETLALSIERSIAAGRPIEPGAIDDAIEAMTIVSEIANQTLHRAADSHVDTAPAPASAQRRDTTVLADVAAAAMSTL